MSSPKFKFVSMEFSEIRSRLARRFEKESKRAYGYSQFIGNSSGSGTNASVRCEKGKPAAEGGRTALKGFLIGEAKGRWHSQ
jgi:hypothetical protein